MAQAVFDSDAAGRVRRRSRNRFHDLRFRRGPARAHAHRGGGRRHARPNRGRAPRGAAGAAAVPVGGTCAGGPGATARHRHAPPRASRRAHRAGERAAAGIRPENSSCVARGFRAQHDRGSDAAVEAVARIAGSAAPGVARGACAGAVAARHARAWIAHGGTPGRPGAEPRPFEPGGRARARLRDRGGQRWLHRAGCAPGEPRRCRRAHVRARRRGRHDHAAPRAGGS